MQSTAQLNRRTQEHFARLRQGAQRSLDVNKLRLVGSIYNKHEESKRLLNGSITRISKLLASCPNEPLHLNEPMLFGDNAQSFPAERIEAMADAIFRWFTNEKPDTRITNQNRGINSAPGWRLASEDKDAFCGFFVPLEQEPEQVLPGRYALPPAATWCNLTHPSELYGAHFTVEDLRVQAQVGIEPFEESWEASREFWLENMRSLGLHPIYSTDAGLEFLRLAARCACASMFVVKIDGRQEVWHVAQSTPIAPCVFPPLMLRVMQSLGHKVQQLVQ